MTGIERLRELYESARRYFELGICDFTYKGAALASVLKDIAGQIEREQEALVRETEDVSGRDSDALAWVEEHGGLESVKEEWNRRSNLDRQLEKAQAKVKRQRRHIEFVQNKCRERQNRVVGLKKMVEFLKFNNSNFRALQADVAERLGFTRYGDDYEPEDLLDALDRRLMPEGMEWPKVDGEPVVIGERLVGYGSGDDGYEVVGVRPTCGWVLTKSYDHITRDGGSVILEWDASKCHRPAPKVLDADGVEIRVGDTVWDVETGCEFVVTKAADGTVFVAYEDVEADRRDPASLTHRAPVLAADGKPLREGETVWVTMDNPYGAPLLKGDEVTVRFVPHAIVHVEDKEGAVWHVGSNDLTHERPDSWERLEEDARAAVCVYFDTIIKDCENCDHYPWMCSYDKAEDLVRRAKALAERDAK